MVPWLPDQYTPDEQNRWLIAADRYDRSILRIRCPQHITRYTLERTIGNTAENTQWARDARRDDRETDEQWTPAMPFPVDPRGMWTEDGRLAFKPKRRKRRSS